MKDVIKRLVKEALEIENKSIFIPLTEPCVRTSYTAHAKPYSVQNHSTDAMYWF